MPKTIEELQKENDALKALVKDGETTISGLKAIIGTYETLGSPADLTSKVNLLAKYEVLGTPDVLIANAAVLASYEALGTPENLAAYTQLGDVDSITAKFETLSKYQEIGTVEDVDASISNAIARIGADSETINAQEDALAAYAALGTPEHLAKIVETYEGYSSLGTPAEVSAVCDVLETYQALGTIEHIEEVFAITEAYTNLGTVEALAAIKESKDKLEKEIADAAKHEAITTLAKRFNISDAMADSIIAMKNGNVDEAAAFLGEIKTSESISPAGADPLIGTKVTTVTGAPATKTLFAAIV